MFSFGRNTGRAPSAAAFELPRTMPLPGGEPFLPELNLSASFQFRTSS